MPVYVALNAYVNYECDQLLDRLEAVEAENRAEKRAMAARAVRTFGPDAQPEAVLQSRSAVELEALREAALKRKCERPGRPLLVREPT